MKATLIALSAAMALAVASPALAAKKHHGGGLPEDPRVAMLGKGTWCNLQSSCNGWDKYFEGLRNHKKYAPTKIVIGKV